MSQVPFDVWMNCARYLADGTNELEGIPPDYALPDGPARTRASALGDILGLD